MPKSGTMKAAVTARGTTLAEFIPARIQATNSAESVAKELGMSRNSVKNWLQSNDWFFINGRWTLIPGSTERRNNGQPIVVAE